MRKRGKLYSIVADTMWVLTVIAFAFLLGIFPQVSTMVVPYYGGTVAQLLIMMMAPAIAMLVFFNLHSGRWPVAEHRRRNIWTSRLACGALVVIALVVFLANKGLTGLPVLTYQDWTFNVDLLAKIALFGTIAFAVIDFFYTKGDDYVASSVNDTAFNDLQLENANLRAQLAARASGAASIGDRRVASRDGLLHPDFQGEADSQVLRRRIVTIIEKPYYARFPGDVPPWLELRAEPQPRRAPALAPLAEPPASRAAAEADAPLPQA